MTSDSFATRSPVLARQTLAAGADLLRHFPVSSMPPSDLLCLLLASAAAARLLAPAGRAHAQGDLFPTPASTNVSTSWSST
jgi:hypothetical protein